VLVFINFFTCAPEVYVYERNPLVMDMDWGTRYCIYTCK